MEYPFISRNLRNNPDTKIPILTYHNVQSPLPPNDPFDYAYTTTPEHFEENVTTLLNNGFETISLNHLYDAVVYGRPLPERPVVITFDDGLEGVWTFAYPIIEKLGIKAVSYVITDWVGTVVEGERYYGWSEANEMKNSGLVEICSHSKRHTDCTAMPTEQLKAEIADSFAALDKHLGKNPLKFFCYPFGLYNEETINALIEIGVNTQATGLGVPTFGDINLSSLLRISVSNSMTGEEIIRRNGL